MRARNAAMFFFFIALAWGAPARSFAAPVPPHLAGVVEGEGTSFQIADSDYMNVGLESSEAITLRMESVSHMVMLKITSATLDATSTRLTLTGLAPDTGYFVYMDGYHELMQIRTDAVGSYVYEQDISQSHFIFIQTVHSTKFIRNDATGGDCVSIGTWDASTATCTLTADLAETMEIDDDGVTIDGAGHTTSGSSTGIGIYLDGRSDVTIKNITVEDFSYGIFFNASSRNTISAVSFFGEEEAGVMVDSPFNTFDSNTFVNDRQALVYFDSDNTTLRDNTISINIDFPNRVQGIVMFSSRNSVITGNTLSGLDQGLLIFDASDAADIHNNTFSGMQQAFLIFDSRDTTVYHNNFIANAEDAIDYSGLYNAFDLPLPIGGNYFSTFDEPNEGCNDENQDGICDAAHVFSSDFDAGQDHSPWTTRNGWEEAQISAANTHSNVLFLPGIEGSRLYEGTGCGKSAEEKLWDPVADSGLSVLLGAGDDKVGQLALDAAGKSVCTDIYTKDGDIVDSVRGLNVYQALIDEMNGLVTSGTVQAWKPIAYDWRLSLDDILNKGAEHDGKIYYDEATSTPYIEQTLRALAATSPTGKVTIVTHSNGGLVAKALLKKLGDADAAKLIDKLVLVAVPQTGAPYDIAALLVGYNAGIYKDVSVSGVTVGSIRIVSNKAARGLVQNSPMAYHLLPSDAYLMSTASDTAHPVIAFTGDGYMKEEAAYGDAITTRQALDDFLLASEGGRTQAAYADLESAKIVNQTLLDYANTTHDALDSWTPPAGIAVDEIAGWGVDTVAGIDFYTLPGQAVSTVSAVPLRRYRPIFVEDGDGTVPAPSALAMASSTSVTRYWVDLSQPNNIPGTKIKYTHGNIFELSFIQDFLKNLVENSTSTLPAYIYVNQPPSQSTIKKLTFFLHSPLTLELTDASGNVTGLARDGSVSEGISGSTYGEFGEVKYITVPEGGVYTLTMHGQESGTFSLDMQESVGGVITATSTIANVPVSPTTLASLSISGGIDTASPLMVDEPGSDTITIAPMTGEVVTYMPPAPVSVVQAPIVLSPGSISIPIVTPRVPVPVLDEATSTIASSATTSRAVAIVRTKKKTITHTALVSTASSTPELANAGVLPQPAAAYAAVATQPTFTKIVGAVYNGLHSLWASLTKLFW